MYTDMEEWTEIRVRVLNGEASRREILRETGMHWKTLKKILTHSEPPGYRMGTEPPVLQGLRIEGALFIRGLQGTIPVMRVGLLCWHEHVVDPAICMPESQQLGTFVLPLVVFHGVPPAESSLPQ